MKNYATSAYAALVGILLSYNVALAQPNGTKYINKQLRHIFSNLNLPPNHKEFLYDMSSHSSDPAFFTSNCPDTLEFQMWLKIYEEMFASAYDTTSFIEPDTLYKKANSYYSDTIPIGIINYDFYKLKNDALTSNKYFNFNTANNTLTDKPNRTSTPYLDSSLFVASPLLRGSNFLDPTFLIDPQFILYDVFNSLKFGQEFNVEINFDDGLGFVSFDPTKKSYHKVNYLNRGDKLLKIQIKHPTSGKIIASSNALFIVNSNLRAIKPDDSIEVPGLNVGVYKGCVGDGLKSGKIVIYLSGFDMLDHIPSQSREVEDIYTNMISTNKVVQLKNQGYTFLVVDYKNSRIDMRFNALYVLNLLETLKDGLDMGQQFVIMGESMGGLIARFVLTYMESSHYAAQDLSPFFAGAHSGSGMIYVQNNPIINTLPSKFALTDKKHNTRLLLTLDSPHQGANLPLSIQHAYSGAMKVLSAASGLNLKALTRSMNLFLDGTAARQMLIYHVDTKNGISYGSDLAKSDFFNQLDNLGNYPNFAKVVALSNGSFRGKPQTNFYTEKDRTEGDRLLDFSTDLYTYVLGHKFPILEAELLCRTNNNISGQIFKASLSVIWIDLNLSLTGPLFKITYKPLINENVFSSAKAYGVNAGGYIGYAGFVSKTPTENSFDLSTRWILNLFHYKQKNIGNGCIRFESHLGFNGFLSSNVDYSVCSDGLHFTLVPVQSAIDYGTLGNSPLNQDIEGEATNIKMAKVNPDVIIGYPESGIFINRHHTGKPTESFRNVKILNITQQAAPNKISTYFSCINFNDDVERGMINLEIGDEELYLENATLDWHAEYETEFDILANQRNPNYVYPSTIQQQNTIGSVFSKENPYSITQTGFASFIVNGQNSPTQIGLNYMAPITGSFNQRSNNLKVCCIDQVGSRMKEESKKEILLTLKKNLEIFPNPNNGDAIVIKYQFLEKGSVRMQLFDNLGRMIMDEALKSDDASLENTSRVSLKPHLKNGIYVLRLIQGSTFLSKRLIINKS